MKPGRAHSIIASTYIIDYEPAAHLGVDSLQLIGGGTLDHPSWAYASMFGSSTEFDADYVDPECEALNVPSTPIIGWRQLSGAKGSLVEVSDIHSGGATIYNYYKDDSEVPHPDDTGDKLSFGDSGFRIVQPAI